MGSAVSEVMGAEAISRTLRRIAHQVIERFEPHSDVVLLGIPTRGVTLGRRLADILADLGFDADFGIIDTTHFRDDRNAGELGPPDQTDVPVPIAGRTVLLVDDVLHTGRTIRAALDAVVALGRPERVLVVALIDRGHRELPIRADFVGKNLPTSSAERVSVRLAEVDGVEGVWLEAAAVTGGGA